jgi:hypothetical protein
MIANSASALALSAGSNVDTRVSADCFAAAAASIAAWRPSTRTCSFSMSRCGTIPGLRRCSSFFTSRSICSSGHPTKDLLRTFWSWQDTAPAQVGRLNVLLCSRLAVDRCGPFRQSADFSAAQDRDQPHHIEPRVSKIGWTPNKSSVNAIGGVSIRRSTLTTSLISARNP